MAKPTFRQGWECNVCGKLMVEMIDSYPPKVLRHYCGHQLVWVGKTDVFRAPDFMAGYIASFVYGKYAWTARDIGDLVERKNAAYGSSFSKSGEFLRLLYPDGLKPEQYKDALLLVRIFDKQMRVATAKEALAESPYADIAGYGILGATEDKDGKR